jgi:signal transduction histidine kinase
MSEPGVSHPFLPGVAVDWVLIVGMVGYAAGYFVVIGTKGTYSPAGMLAVLAAIGGCLLLSRRRPLLATLVTAALFFAVVQTANSSSNGTNAPDAVFVVVALIIYRLAISARVAVSALATILLVAAIQVSAVIATNGVGDGFNPFIIIGSAGPWAIGIAVRLRTKAQDELQARQHELEAEQARYAQESVRYERTRIARELHDVIAHNVSLMVVQASAGQFLATQDRALTAETFDNIADFARRAEAEIGRLVTLLEERPPQRADLSMIDELVASASATGLAVTYHLTGAPSQLDDRVTLTAYRIVQEALTNALKYAPGAPITVTVSQAPDRLTLDVCNGPPTDRRPPAGLAAAGGGHGIGGLRERSAALGGELQAGPTPEGGWRLTAHLPGV